MEVRYTVSLERTDEGFSVWVPGLPGCCRRTDLSDIPKIKNIPSDAVIGKFYRPKKESVTIRLDADVLAWLKATGEGYQTRISTYLRQLMQRNVRGHS
jgi:hypothetical protein